MLVESGGSMVNLDKYGKTPLHCAIVCGQAEVLGLPFLLLRHLALVLVLVSTTTRSQVQ
jgi:ankyrin repeat protein